MKRVGLHPNKALKRRPLGPWLGLLWWLGGTVGVLAALIGGYFGLAAAASRVSLNQPYAAPLDGVRIGLMSNGAHANLHLPVTTAQIDWRTVFPPSDFARLPDQLETIAFGWGHQEFYLNTPTWDDLDPMIGLRAIFGIGPSALQVAYWHDVAETEAYVETAITEAAYQVLVDHMLATLSPGSAGEPQVIPHDRYSGFDRFYQATGRYSFAYTCNEWVRQGLFEAGLPVPLWSPFPAALLRHLAGAAGPS